MSGMRWDKARRRKRDTTPKKPVVVKVHPNSMAAKKWGRTTWERRS